jgi:hypothetical protein
VSEQVVDLLEAIEVEAQHGEALAGLRRPRQSRRHMLVERRPVRQIGQGVVMRHMGDPLLRLPALGDVLDDAQHVSRRAVVAGDGKPLRGDQADAAVRRLHGKVLDQELLARPQHLLVARLDGVGLLPVEHVVGGLADHLLARETEEGFARPIDELVGEVARVLDDEGRRNVLDNGVEEALGVLEFLFGAQPLGHVLVDGDPSAAFHRAVADRNGASVGELHGLGFDPPALEQLGDEAIRIMAERARRHPHLQQFAQVAARIHQVGRQPVHFEVAAVVDQQPAFGVEHEQAVTHVVERRVEARSLVMEALVQDGAGDAEREHRHGNAGDRQRQRRRLQRHRADRARGVGHDLDRAHRGEMMRNDGEREQERRAEHRAQIVAMGRGQQGAGAEHDAERD